MIPFPEADVPRWRRVNALLKEALELSQDQREAWLSLLAPEEQELLPLLRALLARDAAAETDDFMRRSADCVWAEAVAGSSSAIPGALVGPYRLIRELGAGGMGTVWLAERADGGLRRQVAVKLPLYGWAPGVAERLEQERDALASLEHPHIARLYDAGITPEDGRPYLAMEFIDGLPIDVYARNRGLTARARVELLLQVSSAVAYAHGRLIVHRDLKPSNILVTADGSVHLLDFGAAKLLGAEGGQHSQLTREAGRALSPDYASPEQIHGAPITVASDVYSLGVILFELLTGARPYALSRHSTAALEAAIMRTEVPLPSATISDNPRLSRELRGDLDNIVAKALKKSPDERYATVTEFSDDLQRWLRDEPVSARPDSVMYRLAKFVQRNRFVVLAGILVFVALASAAVVTSINMIEARTQRDEARLQAKRAQAQERFANLVMEQTGPGGRPLTREEMIDRSVRAPGRAVRERPALRCQCTDLHLRAIYGSRQHVQGAGVLTEGRGHRPTTSRFPAADQCPVQRSGYRGRRGSVRSRPRASCRGTVVTRRSKGRSDQSAYRLHARGSNTGGRTGRRRDCH